MREIQVEHLEGATVPEDRLATFWDAYIEEYEAQVGALRDLGSPPGAAADYIAQLERNLEGLRGVGGAVGEGSSKPLGTIVANSERKASELAAAAGLTRCSPAEHVRLTAYAAGLTAGP